MFSPGQCISLQQFLSSLDPREVHGHYHKATEQAEKSPLPSCSFKVSPIVLHKSWAGRIPPFCQQVSLKNQNGNIFLEGRVQQQDTVFHSLF